MAVMATSFKILIPKLIYLVPLTPQQALLTHASSGDSWTLTGKTPGHSLTQSLVKSLLLSPGSWHTKGFACALQESVSPMLWKFCNQVSLALKFKFPGDSQSLCQIPRLENLLWDLELSQQCDNFFDIIVLQFVGCLLSGSVA